jgi:hypothetical protein
MEAIRLRAQEEAWQTERRGDEVSVTVPAPLPPNPGNNFSLRRGAVAHTFRFHGPIMSLVVEVISREDPDPCRWHGWPLHFSERDGLGCRLAAPR